MKDDQTLPLVQQERTPEEKADYRAIPYSQQEIARGTNAMTEALHRPAEPSIGLMLQKFIESGITTENVAAFEKLCDIRERMDDKQAEREFNKAFAKLQSELPVIE